ncbi:MAG: hypothetical protein R3F30_05410 [Planctomycetota bacterium]
MLLGYLRPLEARHRRPAPRRARRREFNQAARQGSMATGSLARTRSARFRAAPARGADDDPPLRRFLFCYAGVG